MAESGAVRACYPSSNGWTVTIAGHRPKQGCRDGMGQKSRFDHLRAIACDGADQIFVADTHTVRRIRALTYEFVHELRCVAALAALSLPLLVIIASFLPVHDTSIMPSSGPYMVSCHMGWHAMPLMPCDGYVLYVQQAGMVTTFGEGDEGSFQFGHHQPQHQWQPMSLCMDHDGHMYTLDNDHIIRKLSLANGNPIGTPVIAPIVDIHHHPLAARLRQGMYFISRDV